MSWICFGLARVLLLASVAIAPWLIGAYPVWAQQWLAAGVLAALGCTIAGALSSMSQSQYTSGVRLPLTVMMLAGLWGIGVAQVTLTLPAATDSSAWGAELRAAAADPTSMGEHSPGAASIAPWRTRWQTARLGIVVIAVFLGAQLFRTPTSLVWLLGVLALDGALLSLFGVVQQLSWNEQLYWNIPLRFGGTPFASFVNRNNAAAFLNIGLAACFGGSLAAQALGSREASDRASYGFVLLATITMAGLVACNSRGGIASMIIASLLLIPLLWQGSPLRMWQGLAAAVVLAAGAAAWSGVDQLAWERMKSLANPASAMDGRWQHWQDTFAAFTDRPWLGSGWGTYQYLNLPFQNHDTERLFWNADNLHFELLMEGGILGAVLVTLLLACTGRDVWSTARRGRDGVNQSLTAAGGFMLAALGLQSATDFGLLLMSVALGAAVLLGAVSAQAMTARLTSRRFGPDSLRTSRGRSLAILGLAAAFGVGAGMEFFRLAAPVAFLQTLPGDWNSEEAIAPAELAAALRTSRDLAALHPDNGELHDALAELATFRFRSGMAERLAPGANGDARLQAWRDSGLERLFQLGQALRDPELFADVQQLPEVRENVPEILTASQAAYESSRWLVRPPQRLVLLNRFRNESSQPPRELLVRSMELSAGQSVALARLGNFALGVREDQLAICCWRRALRLRPPLFAVVLASARTAFDDDRIAAAVFERPQEWMQLGQLTSSPAARSVLAERLRNSLQRSDPERSPAMEAWIRGQAAILGGNPEDAVNAMREAVSLDSSRVEWLRELAETLLKTGNPGEAKQHFSAALVLQPQNDSLRRRLQEAVKQMNRAPSAPAGPVDL